MNHSLKTKDMQDFCSCLFISVHTVWVLFSFLAWNIKTILNINSEKGLKSNESCGNFNVIHLAAVIWRNFCFPVCEFFLISYKVISLSFHNENRMSMESRNVRKVLTLRCLRPSTGVLCLLVNGRRCWKRPEQRTKSQSPVLASPQYLTSLSEHRSDWLCLYTTSSVLWFEFKISVTYEKGKLK